MKVAEDVSFCGVADGGMCCLWSHVSFLSFVAGKILKIFRISQLELLKVCGGLGCRFSSYVSNNETSC